MFCVSSGWHQLDGTNETLNCKLPARIRAQVISWYVNSNLVVDSSFFFIPTTTSMQNKLNWSLNQANCTQVYRILRASQLTHTHREKER